MKRALVSLTIVAMFVGCNPGGSSNDQPIEPVRVNASATERGEPAARVHQWRDPEPPPAPPPSPTPTEQVTERTEIIVHPPPPRDLDAEFSAALGDVSACGDSTSQVTRTSASLTAVLTQSGRVSRADVSGIRNATVERCLRARVEGVSLRAPIEGAPRSVHATALVAVAPPLPR